jgi:hypothetical protein
MATKKWALSRGERNRMRHRSKYGVALVRYGVAPNPSTKSGWRATHPNNPPPDRYLCRG